MKSSRPLTYVLKHVSTDITVPLRSTTLPRYCQHSSSPIGVFCINVTAGLVYIVPSYKDLFTSNRNFTLTIEVTDNDNWPVLIRQILVKLEVVVGCEPTHVIRHDSVDVCPLMEADQTPSNSSYSQYIVHSSDEMGGLPNVKKLSFLVPSVILSTFMLFCVGYFVALTYHRWKSRRLRSNLSFYIRYI